MNTYLIGFSEFNDTNRYLQKKFIINIFVDVNFSIYECKYVYMFVLARRFWLWKDVLGCGRKILVVKGIFWLWEEDFGCEGQILVVEGRFWMLKEDFGCGRKILVVEGRFWLRKEDFGCGRKILVVEGRFWLWKGKYGRTICKICEVGFSKMNFKRAKGLICNSDPID